MRALLSWESPFLYISVPVTVPCSWLSFPNNVTYTTHVYVLQTFIVISHKEDFSICILGVCFTFFVRTRDRIYSRKCGIRFGVFIDHTMNTRPMSSLFKVCIQNANALVRHALIFESTVAAIVRQLIAILFTNWNIVHVVTDGAELHCILWWSIDCIELYIIIFLIILSFNFMI